MTPPRRATLRGWRAIEMRAVLLLAALCLAVPNAARADLYLTRHTRSEFKAGGQTGRRDGDEYETWVGDGRVATHEGNKTILVDIGRHWFCIVNHHDSTYVECTLPIVPSEVLSEGLLERYKRVHTTGEVEVTGRTRNLAGKRCKEYRVSYWDVNGEGTSNNHEYTIWATEDVSFDSSAYGEMLEAMRILHNRDEKVREDLESIKGLQVGLEMTRKGNGVESKFVIEAVDISEKTPPVGVYDVPAGYARKSRLTDSDF
jgi:hypothetical protein